jgi:threonine/homoserine/homoserine lactone efflux protein
LCDIDSTCHGSDDRRMLEAYVGVAAVVIMTPGPDTALTIRSTLLGGRAGGMFAALGVVTGQAIWTLAASAGIAALIVASEPAFVAVKLAGAAYLVFLGAQTVAGALRSRGHEGDERTPPGRRALHPSLAYRQGVLSDLGNPKMAAFFTSLLPQFAPADGGAFFTLLGLGLLFCAMTFAWLCVYAVAIARASGLLRRPAVRRALDAVMGTVLIALGLRLAAERPA